MAELSPELRAQIRDFLADYRHPNAINGQDWTEADVDRLAKTAACTHRRDPLDRSRCAARMGKQN